MANKIILLLGLLFCAALPFNCTQGYEVANILSNNNNISVYFEPADIKYPVVVLHGILSSAPKMQEFSDWLSATFDVEVFNLEIGDGEDTSINVQMEEQLNLLCATIYAISELKYGFHFIGMSQGGLLARGYVERCNDYPVVNLITMVSPHGGVIEATLIYMYTDYMQEHFSVANYWRNPKELPIYYEKSYYLAIVNNERKTVMSSIHKERLSSLDNFVMIWSTNDETVNPRESAKFSLYDKDYNLIPIQETELYKNDDLGLRYLDENGRLHIYQTNCSHVEHRDPVCYDQLYPIFSQFLSGDSSNDLIVF